MSPKEKALELAEKFHEEIKYAVDNPQIARNQAKHLSILCCKEIIVGIESIIGDQKHMWREGEKFQWEYYQKVLKYLESL